MLSHSPFLSPLISTAVIPPRSNLILSANNSITIIPPTTPHTPNSLFSAAANTNRQFLRSHRHHATPNKYSPFLKVVLVCVFALILSPRCLYLVCKPPNRIRQLRCKSFQKNIVPNLIDSRSHTIWLIPAGYFGIPRGSTMVSIR